MWYAMRHNVEFTHVMAKLADTYFVSYFCTIDMASCFVCLWVSLKMVARCEKREEAVLLLLLARRRE